MFGIIARLVLSGVFRNAGTLLALASFGYVGNKSKNFLLDFFTSVETTTSKILFLVVLGSLGFVIFYGLLTRMFGLRRGRFLSRLVVWSLPLSFFSLVGYIGVLIYNRETDTLYAYYQYITDKDSIAAINAKHNINHKYNAQQDKNYLKKAISSKYSEAVYDNIFGSVGGAILSQQDEKGYTPLVFAVMRGNKPAIASLCKYADLKQKVEYTPPGANVWLYFGMYNTEYNACKIALYEGKKEMADLINEKGLARWQSWSETRDGTLSSKQGDYVPFL